MIHYGLRLRRCAHAIYPVNLAHSVWTVNPYEQLTLLHDWRPMEMPLIQTGHSIRRSRSPSKDEAHGNISSTRESNIVSSEAAPSSFAISNTAYTIISSVSFRIAFVSTSIVC